MKRLWLILFVISSVCGQDKKDVLVLKGGSIYQGEYVNIENGEVLFTPEGAFGAQPVKIEKIKTLKLSDGRLLIRNGKPHYNRNEYRTMVGGGDGYLNPTISIRLNQSPYFKNLPTTQYLTIGHGLDERVTYNITYGMLESHLELQNDLVGFHFLLVLG